MSRVTNVIVTGTLDPKDDYAQMNDLVVPDGRNSRFVQTSDVEEAWGGSKWPEVDLWAGAFNNLDFDALLDLLVKLPWQLDWGVQVFKHGQDSTTFGVWELTAAGWVERLKEREL